MTLHPQAVAALELWAQGPSISDPGFGPADIATRRADALAAAALEPIEQVDRVEDLDADGVPCRLYTPNGAQRTILFLHGGGFVFGEVATHDGQARRLANRTGSAVLAVDYRRPPEHPFPAAPDDVDTALSWLLVNAGSRGLDLSRVVACGDSAGGNLALVAALRNPNALAATVLVYPFVDASMSGASYAAPDGGMTRAEAAWFWKHYARTPDDLLDPDLSPFVSDTFDGLPPTLVQIAEHDVLADEDHDLARRIAEADVPVETTTYAGMIHGFWRNPQLFDAAEEALAEIAGFLDRHV
ncbi:MAG: alpha/beta hydrolase [Nocardioidaceae bacterium]